MPIFNLQEAAIAYAKAAKRVLGEGPEFLSENQELTPVFVALLFQSVEISLKHLGLDAALFTEKESKDNKLTKNGHGVKEIADLVNSRLGADRNYPVVMALTVGLEHGQETEILDKMLFGAEFASTRQSYQCRNLGYAQLKPGDFALVQGLNPWVIAVSNIAENLPNAVHVVKIGNPPLQILNTSLYGIGVANCIFQ